MTNSPRMSKTSNASNTPSLFISVLLGLPPRLIGNPQKAARKSKTSLAQSGSRKNSKPESSKSASITPGNAGESATYSQETIEAVSAFSNKLFSATVPLAVFANGNGSWIAMKANTNSFEARMAKSPTTLVGIFTADATIRMLLAEFDAAGIK